MDVREVGSDEVLALVGYVEIDAVETAFFHLEVDGAGDDVTRRKFGAFVMIGHEARAVWQSEQAAFAAHRFGNQEGLGHADDRGRSGETG